MELCNQPEYNNPYLDSTTRIMYRIMKKNDCLPYWYVLRMLALWTTTR